MKYPDAQFSEEDVPGGVVIRCRRGEITSQVEVSFRDLEEGDDRVGLSRYRDGFEQAYQQAGLQA